MGRARTQALGSRASRRIVASGDFVSTRPCPTCGASLSEQSRFCGQCGTTIAAAAPVAAPAPEAARHVPDVHEEITVSRERPDLVGVKTLLDSPAAPTGVPTTQMLAQTMADPEAEARARVMRDAALGNAATADAAPTAPAKGNFHETMMMEADNATPPHGGSTTSSRSDRPTAPGDDPGAKPRADASPLSRSVLAPGSVAGPAALAGPAPGGGAPAAPALRTMFGMPATDLNFPPRGAPAQGAPAAQGPQGSQGPSNEGGLGALGRTMALAGSPALAGPPPASGGPAPFNVQKTMLGVAIPGIAPTHAAQGAACAAAESAPAANDGHVDLRSKQSTMLGVAIPGIAPTHGSGQGHAQVPQHQQRDPRIPSQVQNTALGMMAPPELSIVPRPRTLIDEPLPPMPLIAAPQRGVPAVVVVGIIFAIVAIAGGGIAYFALRNSGTLTAVPQLDENGRESLKIGCPTCPDGTTVALGASTATVTGSNAVLPLPAPLSIGDNDLGVKIDRPAGGRSETVKVHVPVAYRVRADLSTLSAKPPAITVRIEATPGSTVTVEDKPVTLDATGRGSYAIDLSKETEGEGEAKSFERKIPFAITAKGGKKESGQLTARAAIVPLAMDAPGRELVTDKAGAAVAGQTRAGSIVTIDGHNVPVDAQGKFGVRVEIAALGEKPLEIIASAPPLAPRIARVKVTRVASLEAAAKDQDAQSPVGYDVFGAEPATKIGQKVVVEGEVVEARVAAGHTVLLVDDKKKCGEHGASCLVRIVHGEEVKAARGDTVRAYGRVLGAVTASGKTVPDIEGALVLPLKAGPKK